MLHLLGVVIAVYDGAAFNLSAVFWGQVAITAIQLMTHYANEYFDLEADRLNQTPTNWSGGSRVLLETALPSKAALIAALLMAAVGFCATLILSIVVRPGIETFLLLIAAQLLAWFYSAPPVRLHSRGFGELTVMLVVAVLTPLTGFYLQTGKIGVLPLLAAAPLCCLQFAMMLAVEFPDAEGDQQAGKYNLVVRFGAPVAARLYVGLLVLAYGVLPELASVGLPLLVARSIASLFPLAVWLIWRTHHGDWHEPSRWNQFAFYTLALLMASAVAELLAFIVLLGVKMM